MENSNIKMKIKNILLAIIGVPMTIVMASEVSNPEFWWLPCLAAVVVFVIIKIAIGGNEDGWNTPHTTK